MPWRSREINGCIQYALQKLRFGWHLIWVQVQRMNQNDTTSNSTHLCVPYTLNLQNVQQNPTERVQGSGGGKAAKNTLEPKRTLDRESNQRPRDPFSGNRPSQIISEPDTAIPYSIPFTFPDQKESPWGFQGGRPMSSVYRRKRNSENPMPEC